MSDLHRLLTDSFSAAYSDQKPDALLNLARQYLPPIVEHNTTFNQVTVHSKNDEIRLQSQTIELRVANTFGIRLFYRGKELTTHEGCIPRDYPWFMPDPTDPDDIAGFATRHVSRGIRGESPWPESQWPQIGGVTQGEQNWPHRAVAFGPYKLDLLRQTAARSQTVRLSPDLPQAPNAYGVINRGLFSLTHTGSIVLSVQITNASPLGLSWAPWLVLGFAVPSEGTLNNPSTILAFPDADPEQPLQQKLCKTWNYMDLNGNRLVLINPQSKTLNEPFKKFYRDVNWTCLAIKGCGYVLITRSVLRHEEQFFPFLEHGRYFVEVEYTGPRVAPKETSTVVIQIDILPLIKLTNGKITAFSAAHGQFEREVCQVLEALCKKINSS